MDDLELKKQAAIPPQERLADMDQEIKNLEWYKQQEEYKVESAIQKKEDAEAAETESRKQQCRIKR